ncbi:hypothetical protein [Fulvimarina endophytica]|nr:hypothetical protein [Fulvimarina endophytica]
MVDRRFRLLRNILSLALLLGLTLPSLAQSDGGSGFFGRGLEQFFGKGEPSDPKTYASPSASELLPDASDVGVPQMQSLKALSPIALPERANGRDTGALDLPSIPAYAPQLKLDPKAIRPKSELVLEAKLSEAGGPVPHGLVWRLFSAMSPLDGRSSLIATSSEPQPHFDVPPGQYIVHATFGRAGVVKRIDFTGEETREIVVLGAGGLKLDATVSEDGANAPASHVTFDVYAETERDSDRELIASGVAPGQILRLNAGLYHIVSSYGSVNARTEADVKVEPGKLSHAVLKHRAAQQTLKLVREKGGEAIADTAWTVTSMSGDVLRKSAGAYASMVLAEGEYVAVARNRDTTYQRVFKVTGGKDADVEVLMSDLVETTSGD